MEIPKVENNKAVVIRADDKTGKILNNDDSYYISEGNNYYKIMNSIADARACAAKELKKGNVEVLIFDDKSEFVEIHRP